MIHLYLDLDSKKITKNLCHIIKTFFFEKKIIQFKYNSQLINWSFSLSAKLSITACPYDSASNKLLNKEK